jgi:pantetheine-phosphate adenylyltransferase
MNKKTIAVYPGSFDPPTNGHIDIISRASNIFSKVIVAITHNYNKKHMFCLQDRIEMMKQSVIKMDNVEVQSFSGLLVDYLQKINSFYVIRGLRALSDFEYEFQMALMNRKLNSKIETIFLMPDQEYTFLSSSMIREIAALNGNFKKFVPAPVYKKMHSKVIKKAE